MDQQTGGVGTDGAITTLVQGGVGFPVTPPLETRTWRLEGPLRCAVGLPGAAPPQDGSRCGRGRTAPGDPGLPAPPPPPPAAPQVPTSSTL